MPSLLHNIRVFARIMREKYFVTPSQRAMREKAEQEMMVQSVVGMLQKQKEERETASAALDSMVKGTINISKELEDMKKSPKFLEKFFNEEEAKKVQAIRENKDPAMARKLSMELEEWKHSVKEFKNDWGRLTPEQMAEKMAERGNKKDTTTMVEEMKKYREKDEKLSKRRTAQKKEVNSEIKSMIQSEEHGGLSPEMRMAFKKRVVQINDEDDMHETERSTSNEEPTQRPMTVFDMEEQKERQGQQPQPVKLPTIKDEARLRELMKKVGMDENDLEKAKEKLVQLQTKLKAEKEMLRAKAREDNMKRE